MKIYYENNFIITNSTFSTIKDSISNMSFQKKKFFLVAASVLCFSLACFLLIRKAVSTLNHKVTAVHEKTNADFVKIENIKAIQAKNSKMTNSKIEEVNNKTIAAETEIQKTKDQVSKLQKEIEALKTQIAADNAHAQTEIEKAKDYAEKLKDHAAELKDQIKDLKAIIKINPKIQIEFQANKKLNEKYQIKIMRAKDYHDQELAIKQAKSLEKADSYFSSFKETDLLAINKNDNKIVGYLRAINDKDRFSFNSNIIVEDHFKLSQEKVEIRLMLHVMLIAHHLGCTVLEKNLCNENKQTIDLYQSFNKFMKVSMNSSVGVNNKNWCEFKFDLKDFKFDEVIKILD